MTDPRIIASIPLENGLTLDLLDASRLLAGDRWLVHLVARIQVPLTPDLLRGVPEGERICEVLKQKDGDVIEYRADLKKHYVDEKDRERTLNEFRDIVLREKVPYLSHPRFARGFVLSRVREIEQGKNRPHLA